MRVLRVFLLVGAAERARCCTCVPITAHVGVRYCPSVLVCVADVAHLCWALHICHSDAQLAWASHICSAPYARPRHGVAVAGGCGALCLGVGDMPGKTSCLEK